MARKRYKPEEIVSMLRQAVVLHGQGKSMADATRQLGISVQLVTHHARLQNDEAAVTINTMAVEHGLGDIDAERPYDHGFLLDT